MPFYAGETVIIDRMSSNLNDFDVLRDKTPLPEAMIIVMFIPVMGAFIVVFVMIVVRSLMVIFLLDKVI